MRAPKRPAAPERPPTPPKALDPLRGKEIGLVTALLGRPNDPGSLYAKAKAGNVKALDHVIKIFDLRRRYRVADAADEEDERDVDD